MAATLVPCILNADTVSDDNLILTADTVTCEHDKNVCVATGHVHVVHQQKTAASDKGQPASYTLDAEKLTVRFQGRSNAPNSPPLPQKDERTSIDTIDATGHVKIVRGDVVAYSDTAQFKQSEDTVTLTGHVKIADPTRGHSESDSASFNRKNGVYTLHNQPASGKRVHIYFNTSSQSR